MNLVIFLMLFVLFINAAAYNLQICNEKEDLYNEDGIFIKSLCMVSQVYSYGKSKIVCEDSGMKLFRVNDHDSQKALFKSASKRFSDRDHSRIWVNGRNFWRFEDSIELYSGAKWLNDNNSQNKCLSIVRHDKNHEMTLEGLSCSSGAWVYCEYSNPELNCSK